jgi:beta-lactamase regulating signal transducer with metallopeptidase domain
VAAELLASWWAWIVVATLQGSALLAAVWLVDRIARRTAWPQLLACLWWLGLARLALPAAMTSPWSVTTSVGATATEAAHSAPSGAALSALFAAWLLGAVFVVAARTARRRALHRSIEACELPRAWRVALQRAQRLARHRRAPRIGVLDSLRGAAVTGPLRATLLLPRAALERAPTAADEHALLHELTHLRRGDLWSDEFAALLRALFWFNPLVWQAAHRLHELSELGCDRAVATALGARAAEYRATLLEAARGWIASRPTRASGELRAFLGPRALLLARLEQLEKRSRTSLPAVRASSAALVGLFAACVLPMAPSAPSLREQALAVFAAEASGEMQSCFALQAAALVLSSPPRSETPGER